MKIVSVTQSSVAQVVAEAVTVLRAGGLIIFPTETTYGAGVLATNQAAVDKLLAYKSRREGKPLSIAVTDLAMAETYVEVNDQAQQLYQQFLPGPVTVVSRGRQAVATGVESEFGTLGVRIPAYPLVLDIVKALGQPITATSANGSGEKRPYTVPDILERLSDKQKSLIDLIIDAGQLPPNPPSTVIDTTLSTPTIFRQGEITLDDQASSHLQTFTTTSETETKDLAKRIVLKHWDDIKERGLVIGLNGSLGAGKTIFTKGVAEFLHITEPLTSPTYNYLEEYEFNRHGVAGMLYHLDVWKIEGPHEWDRLAVDELIKPFTVVVIEWFSQVQNSIKDSATFNKAAHVAVSLTQPQAESEVREILVAEKSV